MAETEDEADVPPGDGWRAIRQGVDLPPPRITVTLSDDAKEDEGVKIKVEGCGIPEINGTYKQCGMNQGKSKFSQKGRWDGRDAEFKIYCGASYWWILLGEFWHRSCCSEIQFFVAFLSKICSSLHRTTNLLLHGKN
jgi:hypothetical protein